MQMGRCFVHVQMRRIYMELRIAFKEAVIKLVQDRFCQFAVFSGSSHIVFVADLENHFIKSFFLFAITDFFVIVFDAAVFSFLLCVELCQSFVKQFVVRLLDGCVAVFDIQMCTGLINVFCEVGAAVVSNNTITRHCADCSSDSCHLQKAVFYKTCFRRSAAGFVTFVKSNAKTLLTLRIKSALRSPRGYAAPAGAYAMFATCTGSAKHGTVAACPSVHSPPIVGEKLQSFLSDCPLQICGFSAETGDALEFVSANALPCLPFTGAWHAPVIAPKEK